MANLTVYLLMVANLRTVDHHLRYPGKLRSLAGPTARWSALRLLYASHLTTDAPPRRVSQIIARHVIDTHLEPSFHELNGYGIL